MIFGNNYVNGFSMLYCHIMDSLLLPLWKLYFNNESVLTNIFHVELFV